ncbi:hypothetical protein DFQ50_108290 [Pseudocitrobacter faecalis]|uniref:Ead/Ea22-like protein n=1 Tax=Pseudocitrobacter faecalis TaxID=1398493 RepID=A0ABX9FVY8_9ENTR|nr:hypothetical protein DFQ50_108290 [Pseudocitrobacter faecalis]
MSMTTELAQRMKSAALKASDGGWVKESGDGWEAICSANDQANGGFIIAHLEGPDAAANREFIQLGNPANVRALVEALEARDKQIAKDVQIKARLCRESNSLHDRLRDAEKRITWLETYSKATLEFREAALNENRHLKLELEIAEKRNAELEARTVKLPATKFCPAEYAGSQLWEEVEIWNKAIEACDAEIRAAGVAVEGE